MLNASLNFQRVVIIFLYISETYFDCVCMLIEGNNSMNSAQKLLYIYFRILSEALSIMPILAYYPKGKGILLSILCLHQTLYFSSEQYFNTE
jgi:hypothetical protein